jgi:hypothetical protein
MSIASKKRLADLKMIEEKLIQEVERASISMNIIWAGEDWDSVIISAVNPDIFKKDGTYHSEGYCQ